MTAEDAILEVTTRAYNRKDGQASLDVGIGDQRYIFTAEAIYDSETGTRTGAILTGVKHSRPRFCGRYLQKLLRSDKL